MYMYDVQVVEDYPCLS